jgi:hypothetical protein
MQHFNSSIANRQSAISHQPSAISHLIFRASKLSILALMFLIFNSILFSAKAQTAGDSLASVINVDSGVVNIDTSVAIHNSSFSVDGGSITKRGRFEMKVADFNGDVTPSAVAGDVVIQGGNEENVQPVVCYTNIFDCTKQRGIITEAGYHQWNLMPCNPANCPGQTFDIFHLDKYGVTINTSFINNPTCTWIAATTINGDLNVNGNTTLSGGIHLNNLNVSKCDNTQYAATISNCGGEGKGLLIKAGSGTAAANAYPILDIPAQ